MFSPGLIIRKLYHIIKNQGEYFSSKFLAVIDNYSAVATAS